MKRIALLSLAALTLTGATLAACTTPTLYGPATTPTAVGFSEYRIQDNRYRVTFQGGDGAPRNQIEDYALLRAAEIAQRDGYDWFRVVGRYGDVAAPRGPTVSIGGGSMDFGRRSAVGVGLGTSFNLSGGPRQSVSLEVMLGKGQRPDEALDARSIIQSIGEGRPPGPSSAPPPPRGGQGI